MHLKYKGMRLLDKNPDDDDGEGGELSDEESWEYRKITGLSWISRTGWGVATKSVDGVGPTSTYFISDTLHDLIRACTPNTKPLRRTQQAAIAAGAPDG